MIYQYSRFKIEKDLLKYRIFKAIKSYAQKAKIRTEMNYDLCHNHLSKKNKNLQRNVLKQWRTIASYNVNHKNRILDTYDVKNHSKLLNNCLKVWRKYARKSSLLK